MNYIETSAKTGENVAEAFEKLGKQCADSVKAEISEQVLLEDKLVLTNSCDG